MERKEREKRKQILWDKVNGWELISLSTIPNNEDDLYHQEEKEEMKGKEESSRYWVQRVTGEIRKGSADGHNWVLEKNLKGWPQFMHQMTGQVILFESDSDDPRFDPSAFKGGSDQIAALKGYFLNELRYITFFCKDLMERYDREAKVGSERTRTLVLREVRRTDKIKMLKTLLAKMRSDIGSKEERKKAKNPFMSLPEVVEAVNISARMDYLHQLALEDFQRIELLRQKMLKQDA